MKWLALAALVVATASSPSLAQSAGHDHSDQKQAPAVQQPMPPKGQPGMGGSGIGGSSKTGMMGGGGMMNSMGGGKMPMIDMMQMMGMMRQPGRGAGSDDGIGLATIDRVEGRIAFLRAELKITDAQNALWNAFSEALRANAKGLGEVRSSMMAVMAGPAQQSLVERFDLQEKWLVARLDGARAIKMALTNLIGALSDDQRKAADELLAPHMGMMAMMQQGQTGSGEMQTGR